MTENRTNWSVSSERAFVVRSGGEYDDWKPDSVYTDRDDAIAEIKERCADFSEWASWEDGGGIIWNSNDAYVAGLRIDVVPLNQDYSETSTTPDDLDDGGEA